ncbi:MAG: hypothetical protein WCQ95_09555 [Bacteroidota bacterium]
MKKLFYFLFVLANSVAVPCLAQKTETQAKPKAVGLGIEAGVGYNSMQTTLKLNTGEDSSATLNHFWMQPCIRLHYDIVLKKFGSNNYLKLKPFAGYYTFGGKLKPDQNGNTDIFAFSSLELGTGISIDINNKFQITPLIKAQYLLSAKHRYLRISNIPTSDIKTDYQTLAADAGLQFRFKYHHFTVGAEAWLGISNFSKLPNRTSKENNFRLLIGYEF